MDAAANPLRRLEHVLAGRRHPGIVDSAPLDERPLRLLVTDDLRRSRLTVLFRLLLALPHLVFLWLWATAIQYTVVLAWFWALVTGELPEFLHRFTASFVRYAFHVGSYVQLVASPFPGFVGRSGYPVDLVLPLKPVRQRRLTILFRAFLALPVLLLASTLLLLVVVAGFLGWFAALATGRMPRGLRDAGAYALAYSADAYAYIFLLYDRYPSSDPEALGPAWALPGHPAALVLADDGRRSRLTVFFRYLLSLPHFVWLTAWAVLALLAAIVNWLAALLRGRPVGALHRFLRAYVRYSTHVYAFLFLVANPFPGFTGTRAYPVDVPLPDASRQSRWTILLRGLLALPAFVVAYAYTYALYTVAVLGWFAALVTGRMPTGLRNLGAVSLRYLAQTYAYSFLVTGRYPDSGPAVAPPPEPDPDPEPEPAP